MTPFYFGSSGRRLFGVYTPAERKRSPCRVVVLCYPWGPEYQFAHQSVCRVGTGLVAGVAVWSRACGSMSLECSPSVPTSVEPHESGAGIVPVTLLQHIQEWFE